MSLWTFLSSHPFVAGSSVLAPCAVGGYYAVKHDYENLPSTYLFKVVPEPSNNVDASEAADGKKYQEFENVNVPYYRLIDGDKSYNQGNYLIYYGSEACGHCMGFLYGNQSIDAGNRFSGRDSMSNGAWMKAYEYTRQESSLKNKNLKFLMFEDIPDERLTSKDEAYWTLPWSTWRQSEPSKGRWQFEYIRHDESAVNFRKVFQAAQKKFGERVAGTPTVVLYKDGVPKIFNQDELPGFETKKQGEDMSNEMQLQNYIKHYYQNTKIT